MQRRRGILFLLLALACGFAAAFAARNYIASQTMAPKVAAVELIDIVVAAADLTLGTPLERGQLKLVAWPAAHVPEGTFRSADAVRERVLRRPLAKGEPVLETALHPVGSGAGLAAALDGDRRAVSVKVDKIVGVAGFIKPGSRVDVIATLRRVDQQQQTPFSQVILQDIPVLAIDQKMEEVENGEPELVSVVTLAVAPLEAEKLTYSAHEGRLQLALRRPGDERIFATRSVGVSDFIRGTPKVGTPRRSIQVIRGGSLSQAPYSGN